MGVRPFDIADAGTVASVVLHRGAVRFHAGIAFSADGAAPRILHLAGHYKVARAEPTKAWAEAVPGLDEIDQEQVAAFALAFLDACPCIAYGLRDRGYLREDGNGQWIYVAGRVGSGMTCATFVQRIYEWAGVPLIDEDSWQEREADHDDQRKLVEYLRSQGADETHVAAVDADVGCVRVRPEEIAVASTCETRPLSFSDAGPAGEALARDVEALW